MTNRDTLPIAGVCVWGGVLLGTVTLGLCIGLLLTTVLNRLPATLSPAQNGQRAVYTRVQCGDTETEQTPWPYA